jgi:ribosome recycling factor
MNQQEILSSVNDHYKNAQEHFGSESNKLRTGRAHPSMVESLVVEAYGQTMPLMQLATITTPEPQLIQISPFDPSNLASIAQAIRDNQSLGLNPVDDGRLIRLQIPALTEERRREIVKQLHAKMEESMISLRLARQEALKKVDEAKKNKLLGDDDAKRTEKQIDDSLATYKSQIEALAKQKEAEILKV